MAVSRPASDLGPRAELGLLAKNGNPGVTGAPVVCKARPTSWLPISQSTLDSQFPLPLLNGLHFSCVYQAATCNLSRSPSVHDISKSESGEDFDVHLVQARISG